MGWVRLATRKANQVPESGPQVTDMDNQTMDEAVTTAPAPRPWIADRQRVDQGKGHSAGNASAASAPPGPGRVTEGATA